MGLEYKNGAEGYVVELNEALNDGTILKEFDGLYYVKRYMADGDHLILTCVDDTQILMGPRGFSARMEMQGSMHDKLKGLEEPEEVKVMKSTSTSSVYFNGLKVRWYYPSSFKFTDESGGKKTPRIYAIRRRLAVSPEETQQRKNGMEPNMAALVRKDTYTVNVLTFGSGGKPTTLVTSIPDLKVEDLVVVKTMSGYSLGNVVEVHEGLQIEPGQAEKVKWVLQKVDVDAIKALEVENENIENVFRDNYQKNIRQSYRDRILSGMSPEAVALLPPSARD